MKTFIFESEIDKDSTLELIKNLELEKDKNISIYFSSNGGIVSFSDLLIHYIESINKKKNITIVAFNTLESCAFDFFIKVNCKKKIIDGCTFMIHLSKPIIDGKIISNAGRKKFKDESTQYHFKKIDKSNQDYYELYKKIGIPEELLNLVKKGKDVPIPIEIVQKIITKN